MVKPQKQGTVPKGIVTTQETQSVVETVERAEIPKNEKDFIRQVMSSDVNAVPEQAPNTGRMLFGKRENSDAPRNVYRETVNLQSGETKEFVWWHCENGGYVGRFELQRVDPKTEEKHLIGYDYNIEATPDNLKKILKFATSRTMFYKKYQSETLKVDKEKFAV